MAVVLITGCSSGFGRQTAFEFARRGDAVYATVRSRQAAARLQAEGAAQGLTVRTPILDVTDPSAIAATVREVLGDAGAIDVLVNNAGVAVPGAFEDLPEASLELVMQTNFFGPVRLTRTVLPQMRAQGSGSVIMVSSLSALVGVPGESIYCASKAALETAAEALRYEAERFNIRVSVVEPGLFDTGMPEKIAAASAPAGSPYHGLMHYLGERMAARLGQGDDPAVVARMIVKIANTDRPAFRYPAGAQAEQVTAKLRQLRESDRDGFIRGIDDTRWWSQGEDAP